MILTTISEITGLPMPKKLQESCGEDSCADQCETYGDGGCINCPVQECMTKLYELEKNEEFIQTLNIDDAFSIKLFNKEGTEIYSRNLFDNKTKYDDILIAHTKPNEDKSVCTMGIIANIETVGLMNLIEQLLVQASERTGQSVPILMLQISTKLTTQELIKRAEGDRCTTCRHDCNEDCGHSEKVNEDYKIDGEPIEEVTNEKGNNDTDSTIISNGCN